MDDGVVFTQSTEPRFLQKLFLCIALALLTSRNCSHSVTIGALDLKLVLSFHLLRFELLSRPLWQHEYKTFDAEAVTTAQVAKRSNKQNQLEND